MPIMLLFLLQNPKFVKSPASEIEVEKYINAYIIVKGKI